MSAAAGVQLSAMNGAPTGSRGWPPSSASAAAVTASDDWRGDGSRNEDGGDRDRGYGADEDPDGSSGGEQDEFKHDLFGLPDQGDLGEDLGLVEPPPTEPTVGTPIEVLPQWDPSTKLVAIGIEGSLAAGSHETAVFNWSVFKAILYMCLFLGTMMVLTHNYEFLLCRSDGLDWCLKTTRFEVCRRAAESATETDPFRIQCKEFCDAYFYTNPLEMGTVSGCLFDIVPGASVDVRGCYSERTPATFRSTCRDPKNCQRDSFDALLGGLKAVAAFLFTSFALECGIAATNWKFAAWHTHEFRHPSLYARVLLAAHKTFPILTQVFFGLLILCFINLIPRYLTFVDYCGQSLNRDGERLGALTHIQTYLVVVSVSTFVVLFLGTRFRKRYTGRGELHRAPFFSYYWIPCNLDCRRQRRRRRGPKWFPATFQACAESHCQFCCCSCPCTCCASCCSGVVDFLCRLFVHPVGRLVAYLWVRRHIIGP